MHGLEHVARLAQTDHAITWWALIPPALDGNWRVPRHQFGRRSIGSDYHRVTFFCISWGSMLYSIVSGTQ